MNKKPRKGSIAYEVSRIAWSAPLVMALADEAVERGMTLPELKTLLGAAYRGAKKRYVYHDEPTPVRRAR